MNKRFTIDSFDAGTRLDVFLTRQISDSRSRVQKMIKEGHVMLNGTEECVPHRALKTGDQIEIVPESASAHREFQASRPKGRGYLPPISSVAAGFSPRSAKEWLLNLFRPQKHITLDILFENDDVLVINKRAGALVHPNENSHEDTVMHAAIRHDRRIAKVGDTPKNRAGIVHRLDRMASGVLIIAKTQSAFTSLKAQFQNRAVKKRYRALVEGSLDNDVGTVARKIARSQKQGRMVARPSSQEGKDAVTHYTVRQRYANATELDVEIETGRTHQIRVHMHSMGHPIVGDSLYAIRNQKRIPFDRLWLHAESLTIQLPHETEPRTFTAPFPKELTELTARLHRV